MAHLKVRPTRAREARSLKPESRESSVRPVLPSFQPPVAAGVLEHFHADVFAKLPVALPLRFVEELVGGRLLRKRRVQPRVFAEIDRLIAGETRLDVDEAPLEAVGIRIRD